MKRLAIVILIVAGGCGPSVAERQAAYKTAKDILEKETVEYGRLVQEKREIESGVRKDMQIEHLNEFRKNDPEPSDKEQLKAYRDREWESRKERDFIGAPNRTNWDEFVTRRDSATAKINNLIVEQKARYERAERMVKEAESQLPK